jgi:hypothetical protein
MQSRVHFSSKLSSSISTKRITLSPEWRICGVPSGVMPQFGFRIVPMLHQVVDVPLGHRPSSLFSNSLKANGKSRIALGDVHYPVSGLDDLKSLVQAP